MRLEHKAIMGELLRLPEVVDKPQEVHQGSASDTRQEKLE